METSRLVGILTKAMEVGLSTRTLPSIFRHTSLSSYWRRDVDTDPQIRAALKAALDCELVRDLFDEKMFNTGSGGWARVTLGHLVTWLLYEANRVGPETALAHLGHFLESDATPATEYLAVWGIKVDEPMELLPGVELIPFSAIPDYGPRLALDPPLLRFDVLSELEAWPMAFLPLRYQPPKAALSRRIRLAPKVQDLEADELPTSNFHQDNVLLNDICIYLTLAGDVAPLPGAMWTVLDEDVPCSGLLGWGWSEPRFDVPSEETQDFGPADAMRASRVLERLEQLGEDLRRQLSVPILRLNQARRRASILDKAIDLGTALEALFLGDRNQRLMSLFGAIYDCRSRAVHSGTLNRTVKVGHRREKTVDLLREGERLCSTAIHKIVEDGTVPVWDDLVLGPRI